MTYFLTIHNEDPDGPVMRLVHPDDTHEDFSLNEEGAERFRSRAEELEITSILGSSTLDFPEDYHTTADAVRLFVERKDA